MRELKLGSGGNWQRALKGKGVKQLVIVQLVTTICYVPYVRPHRHRLLTLSGAVLLMITIRGAHVFPAVLERCVNRRSSGHWSMKYQLHTTWASNRISHRSSPQFATASMKSLWISVFHFPELAFPLLGFPFGITLPLPLLLHNDPFLLEPPPLTETTPGNDSNNGFDMLVQSRDIPGISSNYFLTGSFLILLCSLYMQKVTRQSPSCTIPMQTISAILCNISHYVSLCGDP
jgi:hypothetical protein